MFGWFNKRKEPEDANEQRRKIVKSMFYWLLIGVIASSIGLVFTAGMFMGILFRSGDGSAVASTNQFVQGVVLTSITGTIAALLTYMGMIVKGIVDNLTSGNSEDDRKRNNNASEN